MIFDIETLRILSNFVAPCGAVAAVAKVSREASADRLRRRLHDLEIELFETARARGMLRHPAVALLNDEIRRAVREASAIHLRRWAWHTLRRNERSIPILGIKGLLEQAVGSVRDPRARACIECLGRRARAEVQAHLAVGAVPFASAVWGMTTPRHRRAAVGIVERPRRAGGQRADGAHLPRAA
ncbi:MAG: hypothetical protein OXN89_14630 [Bryobacterales bacterium]|nr:hypothetical protein [Bryobacterales bacterium]